MRELALEHLQPRLLRVHIRRVVALVLLQPVVLDLDDAVDHPVEELPVVRDHEHRAGEAAEPALDPAHPVEVEEVRRLVEQQHVGRLHQDQRERGAVAPSARQPVDGQVPPLLVEAEAREHRVDRVLVRPAADVVHALEQLALLGEQGRHRGIRHRLGQLRADLVEARLRLVHRGEVGAQRLVGALLAVELGELREVPDRGAEGHVDRAARRLAPPEHQLEERRLARAVLADEPDAVAPPQLEERLAQHRSPVELHAHVVQADQAHGCPCVGGGVMTAKASGCREPAMCADRAGRVARVGGLAGPTLPGGRREQAGA